MSKYFFCAKEPTLPNNNSVIDDSEVIYQYKTVTEWHESKKEEWATFDADLGVLTIKKPGIWQLSAAQEFVIQEEEEEQKVNTMSLSLLYNHKMFATSTLSFWEEKRNDIKKLSLQKTTLKCNKGDQIRLEIAAVYPVTLKTLHSTACYFQGKHIAQ